MASPSIDPWGYNFNGPVAPMEERLFCNQKDASSNLAGSTKSYWYIYYEGYCPVCNRTTVDKFRVYNKPKPVEYEKRHLITEAYDWCEY